MKKKQLFIILGVFVFLLLLILAVFLWQSNRSQQGDLETIVPMEGYESVDRDLSTPIEELTPETLQESLNLLEL